MAFKYESSDENDKRILVWAVIALMLGALMALGLFGKAYSLWESPREKIERSMENVVIIDTASSAGTGTTCTSFEVSDLNKARPGSVYDSKLYLHNITDGDIRVRAQAVHIWAGMVDSVPETVFEGGIPAGDKVSVDHRVVIPADASPSDLHLMSEICLEVQVR